MSDSSLNPVPSDSDVRLRRKIAELEDRIQRLERRGFVLPVVGADPSTNAPEGQQAASSVSSVRRLWVRIDGGWHYTTLT